MAHIVMAYIVMAHIVMAYIVMAYTVMAIDTGLRTTFCNSAAAARRLSPSTVEAPTRGHRQRQDTWPRRPGIVACAVINKMMRGYS